MHPWRAWCAALPKQEIPVTVLTTDNRNGNVRRMKLIDFATSQGGTGKIGCPVLAMVANDAECSAATLYMIALGHKSASAKLSVRIARATAGEVSVHDLRPDVFGPPLAADQQKAA